MQRKMRCWNIIQNIENYFLDGKQQQDYRLGDKLKARVSAVDLKKKLSSACGLYDQKGPSKKTAHCAVFIFICAVKTQSVSAREC
jgi:hypothetical protein